MAQLVDNAVDKSALVEVSISVLSCSCQLCTLRCYHYYCTSVAMLRAPFVRRRIFSTVTPISKCLNLYTYFLKLNASYDTRNIINLSSGFLWLSVCGVVVLVRVSFATCTQIQSTNRV